MHNPLTVLAAALLLAAVLCVIFVLSVFCGTVMRAKGNSRRRSRHDEKTDPITEKIRRGEALYTEKAVGIGRKIFVTASDGVRLCGMFIPADGYESSPCEAERTIICVHGHHGTPENNFGLFALRAAAAGCNVLLPDQRAHGGSGGKFTTFGAREKDDVMLWIDAAEKLTSRGGRKPPLYLVGVSMGCAAVLYAAPMCHGKIAGIIADCGFTSPSDIFRHVISAKYRLPRFPFLTLLFLFCRIIAGFDPTADDTRRVLRNPHPPILFVHGGEDRYVPPRMTEETYEAAVGSKRLLIIEGSRHAVNFACGEWQYCRAISEFFGFEL